MHIHVHLNVHVAQSGEAGLLRRGSSAGIIAPQNGAPHPEALSTLLNQVEKPHKASGQRAQEGPINVCQE